MSDDSVALGRQALKAGNWAEARRAFESVLLVEEENPEAHYGLATALWWLGDSRAGVGEASRAYALFRALGDGPRAIECAVWLSFLVHADFANHAAANGWVGRAETLLYGSRDRRLHGWVQVARASLMTDLSAAQELTEQALQLARDCEDVDLELTALAQLGRIRIGTGENAAGFALIDEAMAAALAGERTSLDTVVNAACDMLTACELAQDLERAAQWSRVTDDFVARFGCPYLYAECRVFYGSVLVAKGHWSAAEQELIKGLRLTEGVSPGMHARARTRLAGLRIRQGRLEEAADLLDAIEPDMESEIEATLTRAALQLARQDPSSARATLERARQRISGHGLHVGTTLAMLVEALLACEDRAGASRVAAELSAYAAGGESVLQARAASAEGMVAAATGDAGTAVAQLRTALAAWSRLHQPFESARTLAALGQVLATMNDPAAPRFLRHALESFQELGATLEADRVAHQLRAQGIPVRPARAASGALSDREQQVVRLVAAGLSNPEIAVRLYVSPKTVSHHVSHVLAKLNLRNRAEIAAHAVAEQGSGRLPHAAE